MAIPVQLRPYQVRTTNSVRRAERAQYGPAHLRVCVQSPTGSGKTVMMADLLLDPVPQLVLTHRRVLLDQLHRVLDHYGVKHGIRAAGYAANLQAPIQLAIINTEHERAHVKDKWPLHPCRRVHVDEIHAIKAAMAQRVTNAYLRRGASLVGWSATPREIVHMCDKLIVAATVRELIDQGHLVEPVVFGPDAPDAEKLEQVKRQANGEFSPTALKKVWNCQTVFARVSETYRRLNPGCPSILFAPGVPESLWFAQRLSKQGIRAAHIDGKNVWLDGEHYTSDSDARQAVFDGVRAGDIDVVCNRFVLREGFDMPEIGHAILACPFGSRSSFVQAAGRVLRPFGDRRNAIIQDHGGNWLRHPALDSAQPWEMDTPERIIAAERVEQLRTDAEPEPIYCVECSAIRMAGDTCPVCGHRSLRRARPVIQANGELKLVDGKAYRARRVHRSVDDAGTWSRMYWGAFKNKPDRTFEQLYSYHAFKNNWKWLPRDLPLQPVRARHWFMKVGDVPTSELR